MKLMLGLQLLLKKNKGYILTCDGKGGFTSSSIWYFDKRKLRCVARNTSFNSLGYLYGNVTIGLGYKAERHEGKLTGLSVLVLLLKKLVLQKFLKLKGIRLLPEIFKITIFPFF